MKQAGGHESIRIVVDRNRFFRIFEESYDQINGLSPEEWKGNIEVTFADERGYDAEGLTREWFTEIAKQMFKLSDSGSTYYLNPKSYIHNEHLEYFKFIRWIIGKALLEEQYIECSFVKALYKIMRGVPLTWHDIEDYDNAYYINLKWLFNNNAEILHQSFSETIDFFLKASCTRSDFKWKKHCNYKRKQERIYLKGIILQALYKHQRSNKLILEMILWVDSM